MAGEITFSSYRKDTLGQVGIISNNSYSSNTAGEYYRIEVGNVTYSGDTSAVLSILYTTTFNQKPVLTCSLVHLIEGEESSGSEGTDIVDEIPQVTLKHYIVGSQYAGVDVYVTKSTSDFVVFAINVLIVGI
jgi:hypothetical protein